MEFTPLFLAVAIVTDSRMAVVGLTLLNAISTLLECGIGACADSPLVYELLKRC
jgi:hypothetical protein